MKTIGLLAAMTVSALATADTVDASFKAADPNHFNQLIKPQTFQPSDIKLQTDFLSQKPYEFQNPKPILQNPKDDNERTLIIIAETLENIAPSKADKIRELVFRYQRKETDIETLIKEGNLIRNSLSPKEMAEFQKIFQKNPDIQAVLQRRKEQIAKGKENITSNNKQAEKNGAESLIALFLGIAGAGGAYAVSRFLGRQSRK